MPARSNENITNNISERKRRTAFIQHVKVHHGSLGSCSHESTPVPLFNIKTLLKTGLNKPLLVFFFFSIFVSLQSNYFYVFVECVFTCTDLRAAERVPPPPGSPLSVGTLCPSGALQSSCSLLVNLRSR